MKEWTRHRKEDAVEKIILFLDEVSEGDRAIAYELIATITLAMTFAPPTSGGKK